MFYDRTNSLGRPMHASKLALLFISISKPKPAFVTAFHTAI